jgi:hypothetical protein
MELGILFRSGQSPFARNRFADAAVCSARQFLFYKLLSSFESSLDCLLSFHTFFALLLFCTVAYLPILDVRYDICPGIL